MNNDLISREALREVINNYLTKRQDVIIWDVDMFNMLDNAPTAQPMYFPPCEDCNKKMEEIRQAYDKMKSMERPTGEWIPVTYRPMTEEEVKEACEKWGVKEEILGEWDKRVFTCSLPDDGQEILISHGTYVQEDICSWDEDFCGLEIYGDWDGVDAWMPKPEPYKKGGEKE